MITSYRSWRGVKRCRDAWPARSHWSPARTWAGSKSRREPGPGGRRRRPGGPLRRHRRPRYPLATSKTWMRPPRVENSSAGRLFRGDVAIARRWNGGRTRRHELGGLDVVVANAGIAPLGADGTVAAFVDGFDVDFLGVVNTFSAAMPNLPDGASLIATGSVAAIRGAVDNPASGPGGAAYALAKSMSSSTRARSRNSLRREDPGQRGTSVELQYRDAAQRAMYRFSGPDLRIRARTT